MNEEYPSWPRNRPAFVDKTIGYPGGDPAWRVVGRIPVACWRFSEDKTLVDAFGRDLFTFTRASTSTYCDSSGVLRTAANNEPIFDHDPTTRESLGFRVETTKINRLLQSEDLTSATWTKTNGTISGNSAVTPSLAQTADGFIATVTNGLHTAEQLVTGLTASTSYATSMWVRRGAGHSVSLTMRAESTNASQTVKINFLTGVVVFSNSAEYTSEGGVTHSFGAEQWINGWWRLYISGYPNTTSTGIRVSLQWFGVNGEASYAGDGTTVLGWAWGGQLETGVRHTSYIGPTAAATVTRAAESAAVQGSNFYFIWPASEGTIYTYNQAGITVSVGTWNNAAVGFYGATGNALEPDWRINNNTRPKMRANGVDTFILNVSSSPLGPQEVVFAYRNDGCAAALNGGTALTGNDFDTEVPVLDRMLLANPIGSLEQLFHRRIDIYDRRLSNSAVSLLSGVGSLTDRQRADRASLAPTQALLADPLYTTAGQQPTLDIQFFNRRISGEIFGTTPNFVRASTKLAWDGAQFVDFAVDTPAFQRESTTAPWEYLHEPAATNLLLRSRTFGVSPWTNTLGASANSSSLFSGVGTGSITIPTGNVTGFHQAFTCTASTTYTFSFFVRLGTLPVSDFLIAVRDDTAGVFIAADIVPSVTPVSVEWRRITYTFTTPVGCVLCRVYPFRNTNVLVGGTVAFDQAQVELGFVATSPIITTTATVTRADDSLIILGTSLTNFYNQLGGTIYFEGRSYTQQQQLGGLVSIDDTTANEAIILRHNSLSGQNRIQLAVVDGGVSVASSSTEVDSIQQGSFFKVAAAVQLNSATCALNGALTAIDESLTIPTVTRLSVGAGTGVIRSPIACRRICYFPPGTAQSRLRQLTFYDQDLYRLARQQPALDLRFYNRTIVDAVSGIVPTFTRPSSTKVAWDGTKFFNYPADTPAFQRNSSGQWELYMESAATCVALRSRTPADVFFMIEGTEGAQIPFSLLPEVSALPLIPNSANVNTHYADYNVSGLVAGATYTTSLFIKALNTDTVNLTVFGSGNASYSQSLNVNTGVITVAVSPEYLAQGGFVISSGAIRYTDGWWRLWYTGCPDIAATNRRIRCSLRANGNVETFAGDGITANCLIALHNVTLTNNLHSPIITDGSQVTRAADSLTISGYDFLSFYRGESGVLYADFQPYYSGYAGSGLVPGVAALTNNTSLYGYSLALNSFVTTTSHTFSGRRSSAAAELVASTNLGQYFQANTSYRMAGSFNGTTINLSTNGSEVTSITNTAAPMGQIDRLRVGVQNVAQSPVSELNGGIRRVMFFNAGDAQLRLRQLTAASDDLVVAAQQEPAFDIRFFNRTITDAVSGITPTFTRPSSAKLAWDGRQFISYPADVPAFEFVRGSWHYLSEPSSTNTNVRSHQPVTGFWSVQNQTYAENVNVGLGLGINTWTSTASSGSSLKRVRFNVSTTTNGTWTASWFLKYNTERYLSFTLQNNLGTEGCGAGRFDFLTGAWILSASVFGGATNVTREALSYGNGWWRFSLTTTFNGAVSGLQAIISHDINGTTTSEGVIEGWITQLEQGLIATSPIPTTGSAVTRSADTMTVSGVDFTSFYDVSGMVWSTQYLNPTTTPAATNWGIMCLDNGTFGRGWGTHLQTAGNVRLAYRDDITNAQITVSTPDGLNNVAFFANTATRSISANGSAASSNSTPLTLSPAVDRLRIGTQTIVGSPLTGPLILRRLTSWSSRGPAQTRLANISVLAPALTDPLHITATQLPALDIRFTNRTIVDAIRGITPTFTRPNSPKWALNGSEFVSYPADVPAFQVTGGVWEYLSEPAATNTIRNNSMVGAVVGTPGTRPTNWNDNLAGLDSHLVGIGTEGNINYIDLRVFGTSSGGGVQRIIMEANGIIAALTGQVWTLSVFTKLIAGSLGDGILRLRITERTSGGSNITNQTVSITPGQSSTPLGLCRRVGTITLNGGATTAFINPEVVCSTTAGLTYDFTLRIGWPQLETGSLATSPVVTSGSAVTRAADTMSITGGSLTGFYNQAGGTLFASTTPLDITTARAIAAFEGPTSDNRATLRMNAVGQINLRVQAAAVNVADLLVTTPVTANAVSNYAARIKLDDYAVSSNGLAPVVDTAGAVPTVDRFLIGSGVLNSNFYGGFRRVVYWPPGAAETRIQQLSQTTT